MRLPDYRLTDKNKNLFLDRQGGTLAARETKDGRADAQPSLVSVGVRRGRRKLLAYSRDAGQVLALESLEHRAAAGGYIAHFLGIAHLGNGRN